MLLDEAEPHFGISAKMPIAFFRTSRSIRVRSSSRRSRAISAAWSDGEARGLVGDAAGNAPGCDRAAAPRRIARHCLSIEGWIPSSAAICICGRPLLSNSATASRLNSGVNSRLVFAIRSPSSPRRSVSEVSAKSGEDHTDPGPGQLAHTLKLGGAARGLVAAGPLQSANGRDCTGLSFPSRAGTVGSPARHVPV